MSRRTILIGVLVAGAAIFAHAGAAQAGTVTRTCDFNSQSCRIVYTAANGEVNTVVADWVGIAEISDSTATIVAGADCHLGVDNHHASCDEPDGYCVCGVTADLGNLNDTLTADSVYLSVNGGAGNDSITGTAGGDLLDGGDGDDVIHAGAGDDQITGGNGNDQLFADTGGDPFYNFKDSVDGGAGHDIIHGTDQADDLIGGTGNDTIHGAGGDDYMPNNSGSSADIYDGGDGFDTVDYTGDWAFVDSGGGFFTLQGIKVTLDGVANDGNSFHDTLNADGVGTLLDNIDPSVEKVIGTLGPDTMTAKQCGGGACDPVRPAFFYGAEANDVLQGNNDGGVLDGGPGVDLLSSGSGNDTLVGGDNDDSLAAGAGNDTLDGGNGADTLWPDAGNDTLTGGAGNDSIGGGAGSDKLVEIGGSMTLTDTALTGLGTAR